jgi:hypothetical protein
VSAAHETGDRLAVRRHGPCCGGRIAGPPTWRVFCASLAIATGCAIDVGRLPVVSTRPVVATDLARPPLTRSIEGRSCVWIVFAAPVPRHPSLGEAVDEALAASGSAALWDAQVRYVIYYFPPFGRVCYAVEGRVP